ncbi:MAG TPA: hypothetical protein VGA84_08370 [Thermoanaerobaculia bacterium]
MSIVKRQVITALVFAGFLAVSSAFAQPTDAEMTELRRLREQSAEKWVTLQKTRRFFPRCGSDAFMSGILTAKAASFGVTDFSLIPDQRSVPVLLHDGYPSPLGIESFEMRGRGPFSTLFRLLLFVARFREVEVVRFVTMKLTAETGGAIQLVTRVGQACWDEGVEVDHTKTPRGRSRVQTDVGEYRARLKDLDAAAEAVAHVQDDYQPIWLISALAVVNHDWIGRGVLVTEADFAAPTLIFHGIARGPLARSNVETTLQKTSISRPRIDWSADGDCAVFIATTKLDAPPDQEFFASSATVFAIRPSGLCGRLSSRP